jgi:hypothetical protein
MKTLFDSTRLNGLSLTNRFVRSATQEFMANKHGGVTERLLETYSCGIVLTFSSELLSIYKHFDDPQKYYRGIIGLS